MTFKPYPQARGDGSLGDGWAMLRARLARRMALGLYSERVSIGFERYLTVPVESPAARIPVRLRDFRLDDLPALFPVGGDEAAERERDDVMWRLRAAAHGVLPSRCYVLADAGSDRACHIQWLTGPGYGDAVRRSGALPVLAADEAMLENAFTPLGFRGLGVMAAAVHLIAERARSQGKRRLVAFVDADNAASLKAVERAGLTPCSIRTRRQFAFGTFRTVRFEPNTGTVGRWARPAARDVSDRAPVKDGISSEGDARKAGPPGAD
ncbi:MULTISPECIES: GNAT family protein [Methylobacterium]|uniref:GNAT family N-acetyltransferase n=1 Tax=Methylobacterium oryzae TaxID=334852 RepID=A0ABU7TR53_9HYPH